MTLDKHESKPARLSFAFEATRETRMGEGIPFLPSGSAPTLWEIGWDAMEARAVAAVQDTAPLGDLLYSDIMQSAQIPFALRTVMGRISSAFLTYQWAIKPVLGIADELLALQQGIAQRMERHRKKHRRRRWRGKGGTDIFALPFTGSSYSNQSANGRNSVLCDQSAFIESQDAWWVAKLEPRVSFPELLLQQSNADFHTGLKDPRAHFRALIDVIPWSFFAGYFSTLDTVVNYHTNVIAYDVPEIYLMATCRMKRTIKPISWSSGSTNGWVFATEGYETLIRKRRKRVANPGVRIALDPWLSPNQIANIGALIGALGDLTKRVR